MQPGYTRAGMNRCGITFFGDTMHVIEYRAAREGTGMDSRRYESRPRIMLASPY